MKKILSYNKFSLNEKKDIYKINTTYKYQWVKTTALWNYKEFDRSDRPHNVEKVEQILSQEKFNQPLILQYSHEYKTCYLLEGNHRLLGALKLGIEYVPVRVTTDGAQLKDAHKVIGYYDNEEENPELDIDNLLPSQIGIPNCLDEDGNPVLTETRVLDNLNYDEILSQYPDIEKFEKVEEGCYNILVKMRWWDIHNWMNSETYDKIDYLIQDNKKGFFDEYYKSDDSIKYFLDGDYFTSEMKKVLGLSEDISFDDLQNYISEDFIKTPYYKKYLEEVKNVVWEIYKKKNLNSFELGNFDTPYDGIIKWVYEDKIPNLNNVVGILIKQELIETYDEHVFNHSMFIEVLKDAYHRSIFHEWKISTLEGRISPEMLNFDNIFK